MRKNFKKEMPGVKIILFLSALFLLGCNGESGKTKSNNKAKSLPIEDRAEDNNQITCWGIGDIEFGDDFQSIVAKVGKDNIQEDSLFLEGQFEKLICKVWKGTPKEITVIWEEDKQPFKTIKTLEVSQENSPYKFTNGIKTGTTLKEIVKLNGDKPIKLYGFGWDYGGTFINFGDGKLKGDIPCFGGVFELQTQKADREVMALMGDQEISSSAEAFKKYPAVLRVIRISSL